MTLTIQDIAIESVCIVDDDPEARKSSKYLVQDLELRPMPADGPLGDLDQFLAEMRRSAQAAICDYRLSVRNYATFNGAELVARQYRNRFPAVLCTRWEKADADEIRRYRRYIPALLRPDDLDTDNLIQAWKRCVGEFDDQFVPTRRPWRTLVRVEYVDEERGYVGVIVPGWDPRQGISLILKHLPPRVQEYVRVKERLFAQVNIGAEANEDLYFEAWEVD